MTPELTTYIVNAIEEGSTNEQIISDLLSQGIQPEAVAEAFIEAYDVLGIHAQADQALGSIVRPDHAEPLPQNHIETIQKNDSKIIGISIMGAGLIFLLIVGYFLVAKLSSDTYSTTLQTPTKSATLPSIYTEQNTTPTESRSISEIELPDFVSHQYTPTLIEQNYNANNFSYTDACQVVQQALGSRARDCFGTAEYYRFTYELESNVYCSDSRGNYGKAYNQKIELFEDCDGESWETVQAVSNQGTYSRYKAAEFSHTQIQFLNQSFLYGASLCIGDLLPIEWHASLDINDIIVKLHKAGSDGNNAQKIGEFSATYNENTIPGYGIYHWSVGSLWNGSIVEPGTVYMLILEDKNRQASISSQWFQIRKCTG